MGLLPSTRLVVCPSCAEHIKAPDPHCGAVRTRVEGRTAAATAVLMSLTLAGCTGTAPRPNDGGPNKQPTPAPVKEEPVSAPEPAYGVPLPPQSEPPGPEPEYGVVMAPEPEPAPTPTKDGAKQPVEPKR
jgi:hypothetical protein